MADGWIFQPSAEPRRSKNYMMHYWNTYWGPWMMGYWGTNQWASGRFGGFGMSFILLLLIWSLVWKGMALWKAARLGHKEWFVALLILNTAGILDIAYLYIFSKKGKSVENN